LNNDKKEAIFTTILTILVKYENLKNKPGFDTVEPFATQFLFEVQKIMEPDEFVRIYSALINQFDDVRKERKMKAKMDVITDVGETLKKKKDKRERAKSAMKTGGVSRFKKFKKYL